MEKFKITLRHRVTALICGAGLCAVILALGVVLGPLSPAGEGTHYDGFLAGFQFGLLFWIAALCVIQAVRFGRMLKNETRLRAQYIKERDERNAAIWAKSGGTVLYVCALALLLAGVVAGHFSPAVFFTLISAGMFLLLTKLACTLYYRKTL